ncbi:MAG: VWA domain-containing protein [Acidobacteria bacterium]|nr:MAG: VWA domain-containing protein [Acidobacteriota bacterium]
MTNLRPALRRLVVAALLALLAGTTGAGGDEPPQVTLVPPDGEVLTGLLRFDVLTLGEGIDHLTFWLDGREIRRRNRPPYSLELDVGPLPVPRSLRVTAHDAAGRIVAADELRLNASPHRFAVRLVEPVAGSRQGERLRARAVVDVPPEARLERLELWLDDALAATLRQAPFAVQLDLPQPGAMALIKAVAYLADGRRTEDAVIVNGADHGDEVDVDLVELYTTVVDRNRRPVLGLGAGDFTVYEDGVEQTLSRFEVVRALPIHAVVLLDVSASMAPRLETVRRAATGFFDATAGAGGEDRVAAIVFNDRPRLAVPFTRRRQAFAGGLAGVRAERGTALYDSLIYALFYAGGIPGQRAVLLLSDGVDEVSRFTFDDALEYARRSRVAIYAIGIDLDKGAEGSPRKVLSRFAEETGGRSFFLDDAGALAAAYAAILDELRAKYLLAYHSRSTRPRRGRDAFRRIEVEVHRRGLEAKTLRGYYP